MNFTNLTMKFLREYNIVRFGDICTTDWSKVHYNSMYDRKSGSPMDELQLLLDMLGLKSNLNDHTCIRSARRREHEFVVGLKLVEFYDMAVDWKQIEDEYDKYPERFKDISLLDSVTNQVYIIHHNKKLSIPPLEYNVEPNFDTEIWDSWDYESLERDKIYILLNKGIFVQRIS